MPRRPSLDGRRRYRRVTVTYTVAREHAPTSWPTLSSPEAAAQFARELLAAHDDDREHVLLGVTAPSPRPEGRRVHLRVDDRACNPA